MGWTDEMIEQLTQLWRSGLTTNEIAKELGMSKNSVVGKVHRLNLTSRPSPIKKKDEPNVIDEPVLTEVTPQKELKKAIPVSEPKTPKITLNKIDANAHSNTCLKLSELDSHTCRWPIGDPKDENFCFCGKKVRPGQTYCDEHAAIAYVSPIKK